MRLLLSAIILMVLSSPVMAYTTKDLILYCTEWKATGFSEGFTADQKGQQALACASYMAAVEDFGSQNCVWGEENAKLFRWEASREQLAQFFLNEAEKHPELWEASGYAIIALPSAAPRTFPCIE